ncbi:hypothetical protein KUTeg_011259 [Tegillarca granosa]|uniref:Uncharacterized protein n=1 Tax=Tegillarca granosa TaxID=220873 RepID=A0ABQ9F1C4_TEGGR|nr:hypothetical protein KUTeg_011259 [Tegillarca granosa]
MSKSNLKSSGKFDIRLNQTSTILASRKLTFENQMPQTSTYLTLSEVQNLNAYHEFTCASNLSRVFVVKLKSSIKDLVEKEIELDSVSRTAATHPIRDGIKQRQEAVSACKTFVTRTVENLRAKFSNSEDVKIKSAMCSVLNPGSLSEQILNLEWTN